MKAGFWKAALAIAGIAVAGAFASLFSLREGELVVVSTLGDPRRVVTQPGLHARVPWPIQTVHRFDSRLHVMDLPATELLTSEKKVLVLEPFVVWRTSDARRFLEAVGSRAGAEAQLLDLVTSKLGGAIGRLPFTQVISIEPGAVQIETVLEQVRADIDKLARAELGVSVRGVGLSHLGLPLQNERSVFERMRAERERIAAGYRSEGAERASGIRAVADREASRILAEARGEATLVRARGEAEAARVYSAAHDQDPELYEFLRRLEAYDRILGEDATLVLSADSPLFEPLFELEPERRR